MDSYINLVLVLYQFSYLLKVKMDNRYG